MKRSSHQLIFLYFAVGTIFQLALEQRTGAIDNSPKPSLTQVNTAIELAGGYLERACGPDGKFVYQVNIDTGRKSPQYNVVRHAGAMYALAMFHRAHPDPQALNAMIRAYGFLRKNYIAPGVRPGQLVVWSDPIDQRLKAPHQDAELGATGLSLVALAELRQVQPKSVPLEELQSLGRFLLFLQKDDGSFVHKYRAESGPVQDWDVLYYPGEAALGFVALYEADHSRDWLIAAGKALSFLAKTRSGLSSVPADHWALMATAKLLPHCDPISCPGSLREQLVNHAMQICNSIVREQFRGSADTGIDGSSDPTGRTAPTATRLEGLLSALEFLPRSELRTRIEAVTARGIAFLLRVQITKGPYSGGMPGAFATRSFDSSEIRIDYLQHSLSAWIRYQKILWHGSQLPRDDTNNQSSGQGAAALGSTSQVQPR